MYLADPLPTLTGHRHATKRTGGLTLDISDSSCTCGAIGDASELQSGVRISAVISPHARSTFLQEEIPCLDSGVSRHIVVLLGVHVCTDNTLLLSGFSTPVVVAGESSMDAVFAAAGRG